MVVAEIKKHTLEVFFPGNSFDVFHVIMRDPEEKVIVNEQFTQEWEAIEDLKRLAFRIVAFANQSPTNLGNFSEHHKETREVFELLCRFNNQDPL